MWVQNISHGLEFLYRFLFLRVNEQLVPWFSSCILLCLTKHVLVQAPIPFVRPTTPTTPTTKNVPVKYSRE